MDYFIQRNIPISLTLLIHSHSNLSVCQVHQGFIPLTTIFQVLQEGYTTLSKEFTFVASSSSFPSSTALLSQLEINVYTTLIIEACSLQSLEPGNFVMPREIISNEELLMKNLLGYLQIKTKDQTSPALEECKVKVIKYLQFKFPSKNQYLNSTPRNDIANNRFRDLQGLTGSNIPLHQTNYRNIPVMNQRVYQTPSSLPNQIISRGKDEMSTNTPLYIPQSSQIPTSFINNAQKYITHQTHILSTNINNNSHQKPYDHREHDMNNPMIRFLAYIRKAGFDLVIPQGIYDKILVIIFETVIAKSVSCLRDLIDLTMVIKDSNVLSQMDQVSKTKVRGVLALLKHANILVTEILDEGKSVRLVWTKEIQSFGDFREAHDQYILQFLTENKIKMPLTMRAEIVWVFDEHTKNERLRIIDTFIAKTADFLSTYEYKQTKNIGPKTLLPMKSDNHDLISDFHSLNPFSVTQEDLVTSEALSSDSYQLISEFNLLNIDFDLK